MIYLSEKVAIPGNKLIGKCLLERDQSVPMMASFNDWMVFE